MKKTIWILQATFAITAVALPLEAHAYIDPTTGSIILQGLVATLAGIAVTTRLYWGRIKAFFLRLRGDSDGEPTKDNAEDMDDES